MPEPGREWSWESDETSCVVTPAAPFRFNCSRPWNPPPSNCHRQPGKAHQPGGSQNFRLSVRIRSQPGKHLKKPLQGDASLGMGEDESQAEMSTSTEGHMITGIDAMDVESFRIGE